MADQLQRAVVAPAFVLKGLIRLSFRAVSIPVRVVSIPFRFNWNQDSEAARCPTNLPIAGLADEDKRRVEFALRKAVRKEEEEELVVLWSEMMSLIQEAAERILEELDQATLDLAFWQQRAAAKNKGVFLLLGRGPKQFCLGLWRVLVLKRRRQRQQPLAADEMEQRVVVLQASRARLAQALARVHGAAGAMRVVQRAQNELRRLREEHQQQPSSARGSDILLLVTRDGLARAAEGLAEAVGSLWADAIRQDPRTALQMMGITTAPSAPSRRGKSSKAAARSRKTRAAHAADVTPPPGMGFRIVSSHRLSMEGPHDESPGSPSGSLSPSAAAGGQEGGEGAVAEAEGSQRGPAEGTEEIGEVVTRAVTQPPGVEELRGSVLRAREVLNGPSVSIAERSGSSTLPSEAPSKAPSGPFPDTPLAAASAPSASAATAGSHWDAAGAVEGGQQQTPSAPARIPETGRRGYPFGIVPSWAQRPTLLVQNWLSTSAKVVAGFLLARWLRNRHKDGKLQVWALEGRRRGALAYKHKIVQPLQAVADHLFETFQSQPAIVDREDVRQSRESLRRMLDNFATDVREVPTTGSERPDSGGSPPRATLLGRRPSGSTGSLAAAGASSGPESEQSAAAVIAGMEVLMRKYEEEMRSPWRNFLLGHLPQALLIQVQKLKVDTETAMLQLDQILHANELTISVVAAFPALALTLAGAASLLRLLFPGPEGGEAGRKAAAASAAAATRLRMAMLDVERTLDKLCASSPLAVEADTASFRGAWLEGFGGEADEDRKGREEEAGYFLYRLHLLYRAAHGLLVAPSGAASSSAAAAAADLTGGAGLLLLSGTGSEWRNFQADLLELAAPTSGPGRKRVLAERMGRVYACLQPVAAPPHQ